MEYDLLGILFRWAHILPAIVAAGGTIFMRLALVPASSVLSEEQRVALQADVRSRWLMPLMISLAFLLVSGLYNFISNVRQYQLGGLYHALFLAKFLLALAVMWIASAMVGRSKATERMRANAKYWLTINMTLVILIVLIAGVMRMTPRIPKVDEPVEVPAVASPEAS